MGKRAGWLVVPTIVALLVALMPSAAVASPSRLPDRSAPLPYTQILPAWAAPLALPLAPQTLSLPFLSDADVADAPYGPSPTVDGFIAPGEYAGAGKVTFPGYGGEVEVFFRQDATTLYVAFELPDTSSWPPVPSVSIFLDTLNDGGNAPQTDDFYFRVWRNNSTSEWRGNGGGWTPSGPITWTWGLTETMSGWSVEFGIPFSKLGIVSGTFKELGLGLGNTGYSVEHYWPEGAYGGTPDSWGSLVSSSDWSTFYWKPGPWEDYAPSGLPDFDQKQGNWRKGGKWTHCGPVAAANSLWWFDSKFETPDHAPPAISDTYRLVTSYSPLQWDDHYISDVVPLVDDLSWYFDTNGVRSGVNITGTNVISMFFGLQNYLRDRGLWDDYLVTLVVSPTFDWVADEVMRSEDVILLLGFWEEVAPGIWHRVGGHYVTVAGVDPVSGTIAFSDPFVDNAEQGGQGRVLSGTLLTHYPPHPGDPDPAVHNDAGNVSHDIYLAMPTGSPGGVWGPHEYPLLESLLGANPHPGWPTEPYQEGFVQAEVEFALSVSPYTWKASGYWLPEDDDPVRGVWQPWTDYAPNGLPDFDQKQDCWGAGGGPCPPGPPAQWTFCGPAAAANSLWWFDSKFEPSPTSPITINDNYPLVLPYGPWDDHDPSNVDNPGTPWPLGGEFVEDLASYFNTDQIAPGTVITDVYDGLDQYITDHGLRQGYVITQVKAPDFWWVAEEVEASEDVILLLGFYQNQGTPTEPDWVRLGGHYVTLPGVDKQGGLVAFSDPFFDRAETQWPYAYPGGYPYWMGRVADGWLLPHQHPPGPPDLTHNDAGNVSHDVYFITSTDSPGGVWGPWGYVEDVAQIENFFGQNGEHEGPPQVLPVQTEVEWAVAVSPVADLWVIKTITPTVVSPGDWITARLTFRNMGSLLAENVVLTDLLPSELVNVSWDYWTYPTGLTITARPGITYVWNLPDLAWMEGGVITITAQVSPTLADPLRIITNTVAITTTSVEQYQVPELPNVATATLAVQTADLVITKTVAPTGTMSTGDWLTFTLVYSNAGPAPASGVVITDLLSTLLLTATARFTYTTSYGGLLTATDHYVWQAGTVPPGGWGVITVTAQMTTALGHRMTNRVAIAGWYDRDLTNNDAAREVPLSGATVYLPLVLRNY